MSTSAPYAGRRSGLATVVDIIAAPNAAFERLRIAPTWGWAFLIASVVAAIGSFLISPALQHAAAVSMPAKLAVSPEIAKLPPEQQQSMIALRMNIVRVTFGLSWLFVPIVLLLAGLVQGLIMLIANAVGRGDGTFAKYFALSMNVSVVGYALGAAVLAPIVLLRGASSFDDISSVSASMPSLALAAPAGAHVLAGFLGLFNPFTLWATVLLALGMRRMGRVPAGVAWTAAIVMLVATACFAAFGASRNG